MKKVGPVYIVEVAEHWSFGLALCNDYVHGVYVQLSFLKWAFNLKIPTLRRDGGFHRG